MPSARKVTRVAVGVLLRGDGGVLLADRPAGKPYAGYWEFPGGKIEAGEAVEQALERELHEELGIAIGRSRSWVTFEFDYPHAYVELQFRLVCSWRGEPRPREGQRLRFVDPRRELPQPLLPAAVPALRWLLLPPTIVVASGPTGDRKRRARAASSSMVVKEEAQGGLSECGGSGHGWQGVWANSEDDLRGAAGDNRDFALVRTLELAGRLSGRAGPLPVYLPAGLSLPAGDTEPEGLCITKRWIDLRADRGG